MNCEICNHAVAVSAQKEGTAKICHVCRSSRELVPVALVRLKSGEVRFSVYADAADEPEREEAQIIPAHLAKKDVAQLLDLKARAHELDDSDAENLYDLITDTLPAMVAKTLGV